MLSPVSVLVVAQSSSEIPEGLMNNPVLWTGSFLRWLATLSASMSVAVNTEGCAIHRRMAEGFLLRNYRNSVPEKEPFCLSPQITLSFGLCVMFVS